MIALLVILVVVSLYGVKYADFHADYISKETTTSIKGVFAVLILFSHIKGYLTFETEADKMYASILSHIGQLMVAAFFFYSGYGIFESYKKKQNYLEGFVHKRLLKTLVHFDIAVLLFLIESHFICSHYPLQNYLFCWIGWESIGNSNWFIFDILVCYSIAFVILGKNKWWMHPLFQVVAAVCIFWCFLLFARRSQYWWYDTVFCFPAGMVYSHFKISFDKWIKNNGIRYYTVLISLLFLFFLLYKNRNFVTVSINSSVFCLILVLFTMKVSLNNKFLYWLGINAFSIYILQRLPMNLFAYWGLNSENMLFAVLSIVAVMMTAPLFTRVTTIVDNRYFR